MQTYGLIIFILMMIGIIADILAMPLEYFGKSRNWPGIRLLALCSEITSYVFIAAGVLGIIVLFIMAVSV